MGTDPNDQARKRRHGAELEAALLRAAWDELAEVGYGRLTMGSVALRAHTSEPVLYRRWPNKDELVLAAMAHQRRTHPTTVPDTGSLRGDLVADLTDISDALAGFYAIASAATLSGLRADSGLTPAETRERVMGTRHSAPTRPIYQRAHDRGELDLANVSDAILEMPYDLVRHDLLLHLGPVGRPRIHSIVDELFLPLVACRP